MIGVDERNHKKNTSFSGKIKIFFILIQILLSLDFGFIEYKTLKQKFLLKLMTFLVSLCLGIFIVKMLYNMGDYYYINWGLKFLLEYYLYILILIFTPEHRTFRFYQMKLQQFDSKIQVQTSSFKLDNKIMFCFMLLFSLDMITIFLYYAYSDDYELQMYLQYIFYIPLRSYNLPLIIFYFVYLSMLYRLKQLNVYIESRKSSVLSTLRLYMFLSDSMDNVIKSFRYIVRNNKTFPFYVLILSFFPNKFFLFSILYAYYLTYQE